MSMTRKQDHSIKFFKFLQTCPNLGLHEHVDPTNVMQGLTIKKHCHCVQRQGKIYLNLGILTLDQIIKRNMTTYSECTRSCVISAHHRWTETICTAHDVTLLDNIVKFQGYSYQQPRLSHHQFHHLETLIIEPST